MAPAAVLVAGDVFDRPEPPHSALVALAQGLQSLRETLPDTPVLMAAGARDTPPGPADPGPLGAFDTLAGVEAVTTTTRVRALLTVESERRPRSPPIHSPRTQACGRTEPGCAMGMCSWVMDPWTMRKVRFSHWTRVIGIMWRLGTNIFDARGPARRPLLRRTRACRGYALGGGRRREGFFDVRSRVRAGSLSPDPRSPGRIAGTDPRSSRIGPSG